MHTRTLMSTLRRSRLLRQAVALSMAGQVLTATPLLAQDLTRATAKAGAKLASDVSTVVESTTARTARKARRVASDARRALAKKTMRVNRREPAVTPPRLEIAFGVEVSTSDIRRTRVFEEALLPVGEPSAEDNRTVGQLLQSIASLPRADQAKRIDAHVQADPSSAWAASLLANSGTWYAQEGYFTRAATNWRLAWELTRDASDPATRAIADYAVGAWLAQVTDFGQLDQMATILSQLVGRDVRGAASAKVGYARESLTMLKDHHELATFSGPEALKAYLAVTPTRDPEQSRKTIVKYHPSVSGTTLGDLQLLSRDARLELEIVHLAAIGEIPVPSVVHLRSQHYSAIVGQRDGRYVLRDPGLGGERLVTGDAIRDESTGYFLVSPAQKLGLDARDVPAGEAATVLGHCAPGGPGHYDPPCPNCGGDGPGPKGMPSYSFHPQRVSLVIDDVPVGYSPPVGAAIDFKLSYDHREPRQPQTFDFGSVGAKWSHNWTAYVTEGTLCVHLRNQGQECFQNISNHFLSRAALFPMDTDDTPRYERRLPDGSVEVFTVPDRPASQPGRRIFLSEIIDPQGHTIELTYDSSLRLVSITDAIGQVTTLEYLDSAHPLRVTKVTDPFSRYATLTYDAGGRVATITDAAGMTSSFLYGVGDFIQAMTTPYGTTTFRQEAQFTERRIEATEPSGGTERLEFHWVRSDLTSEVDSSEVPTGFSSSNTHMTLYTSLYWDRQAMAAGATLSNATVTHWKIFPETFSSVPKSRNVPHSVKKPLESRVWYAYSGENGRAGGSNALPTAIGRRLEGGGSQVTQMTYNGQGMVTSRIDPVGRQTNYTYASNGLDLLQVEQVRSGGTDIIQQYADYNSQHLPGTITDAAGQDTDLTYNSFGQPLTVTNAKSETTTYDYDSSGYLESVTGPVSGATTTYTYDAYGRVESVEDADGYVVVTDYDHLNRVTLRTYPDDTTDTNIYSRLDLTEQHDRLGRITRHFYDGFGRRIATRDPAGRTISQVWCDCGSMEALIDANGNRTKWERDVQGRVTREVRADNTTDSHYTYDLTGRLKTVTDPKDQVTTHSYNTDDSLSGTAYTNEEHETPNVSYTYDTYYSRVTTMVDGFGTTSYTYVAPGTDGAGQVATVDGPLTNDTIAYTYDELGRVIQRTINGSANEVDWTFDALGRVTGEENLLGEFTYTYHGVTNRLNTVTYPNGQTSAYSYLDGENDHRLQTIHHKYPNTSTLSKFDYTYDAAGNILTWRQQADSTAVVWKYGYDQADRLTAAVKHATDTPETVLKRYAYAYDPAGNRTVEQIDDAVTLSAYDSLNRLTSQAPGGPMVIAGLLNEPGTVTINGVPAVVDGANNFRGTVPTTSGTNTFTIVAKDASGNQTTKTYEIGVSGLGKTFTYDAAGNLMSDGGRTFEWDALSQLTAVDSGAFRSEFAYDGRQQRRHVVEKEGGVTLAEVHSIWCDDANCEDRGSDGVTVLRRPFGQSEQVLSSGMFFASDHLRSVTEVLGSSGTLLGRYAYGPWGDRSLLVGADVTQVGFTSHQWHPVGNGWLTKYRLLDSSLGRWISEDPVGLLEGPNYYLYVANSPTARVDPLGDQALPIPRSLPGIGRFFPFGMLDPPREVIPDAYVPSSPYPRERPKQCEDWGQRFGCLASGHLTPTGSHPNRTQPGHVVFALGYGKDEVLARKAAMENCSSAVPPHFTTGWWYVRHCKIVKCWRQ